MPITDRDARIIAARWQDGSQPGLLSLASTGAITDDAADEIEARRRDGGDATGELTALAGYCRRHGPRGPVAGWSALSWTSADERELETRLRESSGR